jgi:hypothetical protein
MRSVKAALNSFILYAIILLCSSCGYLVPDCADKDITRMLMEKIVPLGVNSDILELSSIREIGLDASKKTRQCTGFIKTSIIFQNRLAMLKNQDREKLGFFEDLGVQALSLALPNQLSETSFTYSVFFDELSDRFEILIDEDSSRRIDEFSGKVEVANKIVDLAN